MPAPPTTPCPKCGGPNAPTGRDSIRIMRGYDAPRKVRVLEYQCQACGRVSVREADAPPATT